MTPLIALSQSQWAGVTGLSTIILAAITAWYAFLTRRSVKAAERAASAAERSSEASEKSAQASAEAAQAAGRQAEALERAELLDTMPLVSARVSGVRGSTISARLENSGRDAAMNSRIRVVAGHDAGQWVDILRPIPPGTSDPQEENLEFHDPEVIRSGRFAVEVVYQNSRGQEIASQTHNGGGAEYFMVERREPGASPRYRPLIPLPGAPEPLS